VKSGCITRSVLLLGITMMLIDGAHAQNVYQFVRQGRQKEAVVEGDFFVAPDGDDANSGAEDRPFASLSRARDAVREVKRKAPDKDIRIVIRGGEYYLPEGVAFGPEDSGGPKQKITYAAFPGEAPVLIGGVRLGGIRPHKDGIYVADLPAGYKGGQLFENGVRMTLARSPNAGYFHLEKGLNAEGRLAFVYRAGDLDPTGWDLRDAVVNIWPYHDWFNSNHRVSRIDAVTRTIMLEAGARDLREGNRFYVQNVLALLDTPGECCIAYSEGRVYFRPRSGRVEDNSYVVSTARALIAVEGRSDGIVRNVHFEGLDLTISDEDIIAFGKTEDCSVRSCRIENARDTGIEINDHARNIVIYGNEIREHGMHGIALNGRGPGHEDVNHHNTVENNHIHHCGRLIGHGNGVYIQQSGHNRILHNHIHHMPRYATTIKGVRYQVLREQVEGVTWENRHEFLHSRNNLLAFNHIHHVNEDSQDTGAMESWGPGRDNVYDHNLIHDVGNDEFNLQSGMYLDDATDYFTLTNNIIYGVRGTTGNQPIFVKGIGNRIENNILIVDETNDSAIRSLFMADERCDHHEYIRNIICFQNTGDGQGRRADVYDFNNWSDDRVSASDYNVFWSPGGNLSVKGSPADGSLDKWRQLLGGKFDQHSLAADPLFIDAANRDYRLKPESPALRIGFKPIDVTAVGLKADFPARFERD